jgi:hypothetical protein
MGRWERRWKRAVISLSVIDELEEAEAQTARSHLIGLFSVLDRASMQFGFRTSREMVRCLVADNQLMGARWNLISAIDAQISQRLIPRLTGDATNRGNVGSHQIWALTALRLMTPSV